MPGVRSTTPGSRPSSRHACSRVHQRVHVEAQREVEGEFAELDQHIGVAGTAVDHLRCRRAPAGAPHAAAWPRRPVRCAPAQRARHCHGWWRQHRILMACRRRAASAGVQRLEAHGVARRQLAQLPQLGLHHRGRADEAAEARAIGAEDHRHVAGEVDRADCVGVVVDVRWVQAGLAAVAARPLSASGRPGARRCGWSCSAPASRLRRRSRCRPGVKKSGAACGPISTPMSQCVYIRTAAAWGQRGLGLRRASASGSRSVGRRLAEVQHVAAAQHASAVAAELPQREGGAAAQVVGHVEATGHREVGATAGCAALADARRCAASARLRTVMDWPHRHRPPRRALSSIGAPQHRHRGRAAKAQRRTCHGDLQRRRALARCRAGGWPGAGPAGPSGPTAARRRPSSRGAPASPAPWSARRALTTSIARLGAL